MKRCRRQHEAERSETRRDGLCQLLWAVGVKEDDGSLRCSERALLLAADRAVAADELQVARHERERLCFAPFALAQSTDRFGTGGIASEMIAPPRMRFAASATASAAPAHSGAGAASAISEAVGPQRGQAIASA